MDTEDRLEVRNEFDKKVEWQRLTELEHERQKVNERIACLRQEIVSLSRKANKLGEEYHTELCKVKPSVVGPAPGEREKARKAKTKADILVGKLKGINPDKMAKLADLLDL